MTTSLSEHPVQTAAAMPRVPAVRLEPRPGWAALNLKEIWQYRDLLWFLASRDVKVRYKQTVLGILWAVIQPVVETLIFFVVFNQLAKVQSDGPPYPVFAFAAMLVWKLFESALTQASNSLVNSQQMLTKVYFPRLIVPLSAVLIGVVDFLLAGTVLVGMMAWYRIMPGPEVLLLPVFALFAVTAALAMGLWLSAMNVYYRDIRYLLPFLMRVWFFVTPVIYPTVHIPEKWRFIYGLNPMVGVVQGFRWALLGGGASGSDPPGAMLWASLAATILLLVGGLFYFRRVEKTFADVVQPMSDRSIQVEGLGKRYHIGNREHYYTLRDAIVKLATLPKRLAGRLARGEQMVNARNHFWALKDVSFELHQGDVLGVIGRNGAGKSTLLKLLSRITEPTEGYADIYGRVGSLLEVGTGFHQELSGRENIYMSGALLGMRKAEIDRKFDEIVAFSECEKFIDTPVKRYSSGMYTRLGFAVAAHLEPEILVVDEVLAVGDASFQKKCLGKMGEVASHGRTVLFVSHNMAAVQALCSKALLLRQGQVQQVGPVHDVVQEYLKMVSADEASPLHERKDRQGDGSARLTALRVQDAEGAGVIRTGSKVKLTVEWESARPVRNARFWIRICDLTNVGMFVLDSDTMGGLGELPARGSATVVTDTIRLTPGRCYVNAALLKGGGVCDNVEQATYFDVESESIYGHGTLPDRQDAVTVIKQAWEVGGAA